MVSNPDAHIAPERFAHSAAWSAYCGICPAPHRERKTWLAFLAGWLAKADQRLAHSRINQYTQAAPYSAPEPMQGAEALAVGSIAMLIAETGST